MSTTNRAFIKAYRHDAPQRKPASAETNAGAVSRASNDTAQATNEGLRATGARRFQNAEHAEPSGTRASTAAVTASASSTASPKSATERKPLSSYISQSPPAEVIEAPTRQDAFRAGTTVANFNWPAVCRSLLQQGGTQLDHVVRIMLARAATGNSLVGVFGLFPRVGATTTALCLASRAASSARRVVLADGNLRSPRVASLLEAVPTFGWEDVLKSRAPLADAVIHATNENLDVLALGPRPVKDPQALASGLQAAVTAGVLRHAYELVILDLGTFFDPLSQPMLLELVSNMGVDAAVAVMGPEPADPRDVATIVELLGRSECELLGVIENRIATPRAA